MKANARKAVFAVLLNIFLIALALYIFDMLNVFTFGQLASRAGFGDDSAPKIEDPFLLEKEELKKRWKLVSLKEKEQQSALSEIKENKQELEDLKERVKSREKQLKAQEQQYEQEQADARDRQQRIRAVAQQLMNMEPQKAVDRLEKQKDDLLVIELLQSMDAQYQEQGQQSVVPYLLSLMNTNRAAELQRKMANMPANENPVIP